MDLELSLTLPQSQFLAGESIVGDVVLRYQGKTPVQLPSLDLNDQVLAFAVATSSGNAVGTYDNRDFQELVGASRVREDRVQLRDFAPGDSDSVGQDLLLLRAPLPEGEYTVAAHYRWKQYSAESAPVAFRVVASRPGRAAVGWDRDEGGPYHLMLAYEDRGLGDDLLMEATTFGSDHRAFDHTLRVTQLQSLDDLAVARDLGATAEMQSTIVWKQDGALYWRGVDAAESFPIRHAAVDLPGFSITRAPYREGPDTTLVLLVDGSGSSFLAMGLHADGSTTEIARQKVDGCTAAVFVCTLEGGPLLIAASQEGSSQWKVQSVPLGRRGGAIDLWRGSRPVAALDALVDETGRACCAIGVLDPKGESLFTTLVQCDDPKNAEQIAPFAVTPKSQLTLRLGADRSVHVLEQTGDSGVKYASAGEGLRAIAPEGTLMSNAPLVVGRSGQAYLLTSDPQRGVRLQPLGAAGVPGHR